VTVPVTLVHTFPPAAYLLYFHAQESATGLGTPSLSISGSASGSGVAIVYTMIEEVTPSGQVVATTHLSDLSFSSSGLQTDSTGDIRWITWSYTSSTQDVHITAAVSSVMGILNVGGAPITPKNTETFFEVTQHTYQSTSNHLRLTLYSAAASATTSYSHSTNTFISGVGASQVYVHFAGEAVVDGNSASVTVSGVADTNYNLNDIGHSVIQSALSGNASLTIHVRKVTVDFPAGASKISYDPAQGFDAPKSYAGAATVSASAFLVFASAFAALLL